MKCGLGTVLGLLGLGVHALGALPPDVQIARFRHDCRGAYSLTFDDGLASHVTTAIPILDRHALKATFFLFTDNVGQEPPQNWAAWRAAAEAGHEIGSHSQSHLNLTITEDRSVLQAEIAGSAQIIAEMTGVRPLSFAYPYSAANDFVKRLVLDAYLFDRSDCRVWGGDDFTAEMGKEHVQRAIARREWEYVMLHGVGEETWGKLDPAVLDALAAFLAAKTDDVWTATYAEVSTYIRKRNAVRIIRRDVQDDAFRFRLSLPDRPEFRALPPMPLTVRIPLEGRDAARAQARLGAKILPVRVSADGVYLLAEVPTDGSWVHVQW